MLKLSDNPPVQSENMNVFQTPGRWWVAHTRSRCEKALAWDMIDRQIAYFLPMVDRISISGGKKRRARITLFPSHVFLKGDSDVRSAALGTGRACRVIEVLDQAALHTELLAMQQALNSGIRMDPYQQPLVGEGCRVASGPLQGVGCTAVKWGRLATIVLPLTLLRRGVLMQIDASLLERLPVTPVESSFVGSSIAATFRISEETAPAVPNIITRMDVDRIRMGKTYAAGT